MNERGQYRQPTFWAFVLGSGIVAGGTYIYLRTQRELRLVREAYEKLGIRYLGYKGEIPRAVVVKTR